MDQTRIVLSNFSYVPLRNGRALRFDFTWEFDQPDGLHLASTHEGCLAYVENGEVNWHFSKTFIRGRWAVVQYPSPDLVEWVRGRLEESGVLKELLADDELRKEARDLVVGEGPPKTVIREEL